jgi:hypothetical protein
MGMYDSCYAAANLNNRFNVTRKDFTIEVDVYFRFNAFDTNGGRTVFRSTAANIFEVGRYSDKTAYANFITDQALIRISTSFTLSTSSWYRLSFCRQGDIWKVAVDGVVRGSVSHSGSLVGSGFGVRMGGNDYGGVYGIYYTDGYLANFQMNFRNSLY